LSPAVWNGKPRRKPAHRLDQPAELHVEGFGVYVASHNALCRSQVVAQVVAPGKPRIRARAPKQNGAELQIGWSYFVYRALHPPRGYAFIGCNWKKRKAKFVSPTGNLKFVGF
jgi:hypothetical protein